MFSYGNTENPSPFPTTQKRRAEAQIKGHKKLHPPNSKPSREPLLAPKYWRDPDHVQHASPRVLVLFPDLSNGMCWNVQ